MPRYLISFDDGTMIVPDGQLAAVSDAARAVVQAARDAGVYVTAAGLMQQPTSVVALDGSATTTAYPHAKSSIGGFTIVDVATHDEALAWGARLAQACGCPQDVRELAHDPLAD